MNLPIDQIICGDNCDRTPLHSELVCRGCGANWKHDTGRTRTACPFCGKPKDARKRKYPKSKEQQAGFVNLIGDKKVKNSYSKKSRQLTRKRVFFRISGTPDFKCVRCGCNDPRFLEINHKLGGGAKEIRNEVRDGRRLNNSEKFYRDIANGVRRTDDLELLCKPCNAIHALELRFGIVNMEVKWHG